MVMTSTLPLSPIKAEASQPVIEMTTEPKTADQKPATVMPASIQATRESIAALMTSRNRPSVRMVSGRVSRITIGRTMALTMPSSSAAQTSDQASAISTPGTSFEATQRPIATITIRRSRPLMCSPFALPTG